MPKTFLDRRHFGDIRDFPPTLLDGVDAVIHLAAISNDPMGKEFEAVTEAIIWIALSGGGSDGRWPPFAYRETGANCSICGRKLYVGFPFCCS